MNNFLKSVANVLSTKIIIYIVAIVSSIMLARMLGPAGKGKLAIITSVYSMVLQFGCLGLQSAHTYYISKNRDEVKKCEGNNFFITAISFALCLVLMPYFIRHQQLLKLDVISLVLSFALVPVNMFFTLQENLFIAVGDIKHFNILELLNNTLYFVLVVIIYLFAQVQVTNVAASILVSVLVIDIYSLKVYNAKIEKKINFSMHYLISILPYGIKSYMASLACYLVLRVDILMLNYYLDEYDVGIYSLATSLVDICYMVSSSISLVLFPKLGAENNFREKIKLIKKVVSLSAPVIISVYLCLGLFAKIGIGLLYGKQYESAIYIVYILVPGGIFWSISNIFFNLFASENKFMATIIVPFIALFSNILMNLFLIPNLGYIGAAIASTCSYGICLVGIFIYTCLYVQRKNRKL